MQTLWYQLYVNPNREEVCKEQVQKAQRDGCRALFITVDAPQLGRRERDMRNKAGEASDIHKAKGTKMEKSKGTSAQLTSYIDPALCWDDIVWFDQVIREQWENDGKQGEPMKIVLKGVQSGADAVKAAEQTSSDGRQLVAGIGTMRSVLCGWFALTALMPEL